MNAYETWLKGKLEGQGWTVLRDGWPDFLCFRGSISAPAEVMAIEAKMPTQVLSSTQQEVRSILTASGIPYRLVRPGDIGVDTSLREALEHQYFVRSKGRPFEHRARCKICTCERERG